MHKVNPKFHRAPVIFLALLFFALSFMPAFPASTASARPSYQLGLVIDSADKTALSRHQTVPEVGPTMAAELPASIDWSEYLPEPGDQGDQGSCVGWSMAYAYKSYQEQQERNWGLVSSDHLFSPAYIYNQSAQGYDQGMSPVDAANMLVAQGCDTLDDFPYYDSDCSTQPSSEQKVRAALFKEASWSSLNVDNQDNLKSALANGPIQAGVEVYWNTGWDGSGEINASDISSNNYAGSHSICLVGYDDNHMTSDGTGAFKFINSWGTAWGDGGYGWISYDYADSEMLEAIEMVDIVDEPAGEPFAVSGTVTADAAITSLPATALTFSRISGTGNLPASTSTDSAGSWTQTGFEEGTSYRVTPSASGYAYTPAYIDFTAASSTLNFSCSKAAASISISSPDANTEAVIGQSQNISWTAAGDTGDLTITLLQNGSAVKTIASNVDPDAGLFRWKVPTSLSAGDNYQVMIGGAASSSIVAYSESFCIVEEDNDDDDDDDNDNGFGLLSLTSPSSGDTWTRGASQTITWDYGIFLGLVQVSLCKDGEQVKSIGLIPCLNLFGGSGSCTYKPPTSLEAGSDYTVVVRTLTGLNRDASPAFTID